MILVTGGTGQLGTAFRQIHPEAAYPGRDELDLSRPNSVDAWLQEHEPALVINCGAYTAVDRAEEEEELATVVNGTSVGVLARYTAASGARLVTFSTDYVFAGDATSPYVESDPTDPINAYGRSKRHGEVLAIETDPTALVVRTSWVISGTHPNFVATMLRLVPDRELRVVDDQRGRPTVASDLAAGTARLLDAGAEGIVHLANEGETTWFELARAAVALGGHDPDRIAPCATEDYPTPARRPAYSVLGSERLDALGVPGLPDWRESLPAVVEGLLAR